MGFHWRLWVSISVNGFLMAIIGGYWQLWVSINVNGFQFVIMGL